MTTYTLAETATRVLRDLGLIDANETPSAVDLTMAEETVSAEIATMASIGMPIWNGSDLSVPLEYLMPLSRRIGLALAPSYGLTDVATATNAMREAERVLTMLAAPRGITPLALRSNDATGYRRTAFNFTTGQ